VKYNEYTLEERVKMGRYGTENGSAKVARHYLSAFRREAVYVVVVTPFFWLMNRITIFKFAKF